jgi:hypothetical protein
MPEAPLTSEFHRRAVFVTGFDAFKIPQRTAGLHNG